MGKMTRRLFAKDYSKDSVSLAPWLLGKLLCRNAGGEIIKLRITETEAYYGEDDTACHAHKGKTKRTSVMYLEGGHSYVFLCYGVHWLFNVVTGKKDFPEAVLIRGVEGFNGPGKLTKALFIDKELNGENLVESNRIWIEEQKTSQQERLTPPCGEIFECLKRIGIKYASEEDQNKLWRFVLKN